MYNPANLHECEKEKSKTPRAIIDTFMTLVGAIASVSSIPQILKIWNTHTVVGISLTTEFLAFFAVIIWFFYGMYIRNKPLMITSGLSSVVLATVIVQIFLYS
tara:strand:+ start:342385 stop:342693 length:309 start_codon:yes stop_codon:yes gene_type:complete